MGEKSYQEITGLEDFSSKSTNSKQQPLFENKNTRGERDRESEREGVW